MTADQLEKAFPALAGTVYVQTSPSDAKYNCIAWAAGDDKRWWEPDPFGINFWPADAPREYTIEAFQTAFRTLGYQKCNGPQHDEALEKVALFCKAGVPTHASRQLNEVFWTSKLGQEIDISHDLEAISGKAYGEVSEILARAKPA